MGENKKVSITIISTTGIGIIVQSVFLYFKYVLDKDMPWFVTWFPSLVVVGLPLAAICIILAIGLVIGAIALIVLGIYFLFHWVNEKYGTTEAFIVYSIIILILGIILGVVLW